MHIKAILLKLNMSFLIKDDEILEKYNEIWKNVRNSIKKEFDGESWYDVLTRLSSVFRRMQTCCLKQRDVQIYY